MGPLGYIFLGSKKDSFDFSRFWFETTLPKIWCLHFQTKIISVSFRGGMTEKCWTSMLNAGGGCLGMVMNWLMNWSSSRILAGLWFTKRCSPTKEPPWTSTNSSAIHGGSWRCMSQKTAESHLNQEEELFQPKSSVLSCLELLHSAPHKNPWGAENRCLCFKWLTKLNELGC